MILKKASDFIDTIGSIRSYVNKGMFRPDLQQMDSTLAISARIAKAILAIRKLLEKKDYRSSVNAQDIINIFGAAKSDASAFEAASKGAMFLSNNKTSTVDFYEFILEFIFVITAKPAMERAFARHGGESLVKEIESLLEAAKFRKMDEKDEKEVEPSEEPTLLETEELYSKWYVSSGDKFSGAIPFYGPFDSNIQAVIFSILIHRAGFSEEASVVPYENLVRIFKNIGLDVSKISEARDIHSASIINEGVSGRIKQQSLNITKGKHTVELSTSGDVFDSFVQFIIEKLNFQSDEVISLSDLSRWMDRDSVLSFADYYLKKYGPKDAIPSSAEGVSNIDPVLVKQLPIDKQKQKEEGNKQKIKQETRVEIQPEDEKEWMSKAHSSISEFASIAEKSNITIISKENSEVLSDQSILEFFNNIKIQAKALESISKSEIERNYKDSLSALEYFFEKVLDKEFLTKKALKEFRQANPLTLSVNMDYEWEFRENFSCLKKILNDNETRRSLVSVMVIFANQEFFSKEDFLSKLRAKVKQYIARRAITGDNGTDVDNAASEIRAKTISEVSRILDLEFEKSCNKILYSNGLIKNDSKKFVEGIINQISLYKIVYNAMDNYFDSKEKISETQRFCLVKCGVCSQLTQIPEQYNNLIEDFSREIEQYSFFRRDQSVITEQELLDGDKEYPISSEASRLISEQIERSKKLFPKQNFDSFLRNQFTWKEVNLMISSSEELNNTSINGVEGNIIGLIIRNDILKNQFDAMPTGRKDIFKNRSFCAASLIGLSESIKSSDSTRKYLEQQGDFKCKATISADYRPADVPKYLSSAYIQPGGNILGRKDVTSYFSGGFRFSKNEVNCPCHIGADSDLVSIANEKQFYKDIFGFVAIPSIPESLAEGLADKFGKRKESLYSAPTSPSGGFATNIPESGYVICGKKVSLSLLDKDPSSQNNIRSVLSKIYQEKGKDELVAVINLLINYGVEMNDIRPHVEDVLSFDVSRKVAKKTIADLFRQVKVSLAQELVSPSIIKLRDIGLVCEHGHKFTIGQSWDFARTHFAIAPRGRVSTMEKKGLIHKKLRIKDMIDLIKADPSNSAKLMFTTPGENISGFGVFNANVSKEYLESGGYKQATEASSYEELRDLIKKNLLYYQSDDGAIYIISSKIERGALISSPWASDIIKLSPQRTTNISAYAGPMTSLSTPESGQSDIEDTSKDEVEEYDDDDDDDDMKYKDEFSKILFPDFEISIKSLSDLKNQVLVSKAKESQDGLKESSKQFIEKFIRTMRLARVWGLMAADANIDFLKRPTSLPKANPNIENMIKGELSNLSALLGKSEQEYNSIFQRFFESYDILGLISRSVSQDKFLSLAGITQYYKGFSTPFIANKKDEEAKRMIFDGIKNALISNLPAIIGTNSTDPRAQEVIQESADILAEYLFSPYESYDFSRISETAIVNYSGRSMIFSFSLDLVDRIRAFYSTFFSNQASSVYIGTFGNNDDAISSIEDLLSLQTEGDNSFFKIFLMEEQEFEQKLSKIKKGLEETIGAPTVLVDNFLKAKGVNKSSGKTFMMQAIIVFSRFSKSLNIASNSLESITSDLAGKPMGSPQIKKAAKTLDLIIEPLLKRRYPDSFEQAKERVFKSRNILGGSENLFSTNSVGTARINLSKANDSLAPIISQLYSFYSFSIKKDILVGLNEDVKIDPKLSLLTSIFVKNDLTKEKNELYICLVPRETIIFDQMVKKNIDLMDYLPNEITKLNTIQGREFAARYLASLEGIDYSRLVLVDARFKHGRISKSQDPSIIELQNKNSRFDIKVSKIGNQNETWPPQKNLLFDERTYKMYNSQSDVNQINSYMNETYGKDHSEFIANIGKFPSSLDAKTPEVSSDFGVIIPLRGEAFTRMITNTSESGAKRIYDLISISKAEIFITLASGQKVDISWAFKTLDPQFFENGALKHTMVQSGVVQKLGYISREMNQIYNELNRFAGDIFERTYGEAKISLKSRDEFLETFFSVASPSIIFSEDISLGIKKASLNNNYVNALESDFKNYSQIVGSSNKTDTLERFNSIKFNLLKLVDYYNAAHILNATYLNQQPTIIDAKSVNLSTNKPGTSLAVHLLDPYSLWMMVSNPFMSKRFGGPIDSNHIDDYKTFIIETFGISEIVREVVEATGIKASRFEEKDLFDLSGFYNRYYKQDGNSESPELKRFAELFKLNIDVVENNHNAKSYINGYPIFNGESEDIKSIMSSASNYSKEFCLNQDSFIEHPYRFEYILENMTESEIIKIKKVIEKNIDKEKIKDNIWREERVEGQGSILSRMKGELEKMKGSKAPILKKIREKYEDMVDELTVEKVDEIVNKEFLKNESVLSQLSRNKKLESGEDTLSLDELLSLAKSFGIVRKERPVGEPTISDYRALTMEINSNLRRILANIYNPITKESKDYISWRKIAQFETDNESTIIASQYHKWWDAYLAVMEKLSR
jgi:hypothetical protein